MSVEIKIPKKLIEVALPLDAINIASAREKTIRHGHPSNLHRWWARRPLAAARAVIFAQMVNDPGYQQGSGFVYGVNKEKAEIERERLFKIIEDLVKWENNNNEDVLERARAEIRRSWQEICELNKSHPQARELFNSNKLPFFHDPFAGGGAIPLEAQRLGLASFASDLNPVAVTINKAMIEITSKFVGRPPVGPVIPTEKQDKFPKEWDGLSGLSEDIKRYGTWVRNECIKSVGHLYPQIEVTEKMSKERPDLKPLVGKSLDVIAWIWARTVRSPNPAFSHQQVPLATSFVLSNKSGKETYVEPIISNDNYEFKIKIGELTDTAKSGTKANGRGSNFECLLSKSPISGDYIKSEGQAGRIGTRLMAIVAEGVRGRVYLAPTKEHEEIAKGASPKWQPMGKIPARLTGGTCVPYGLKEWRDIFTSRQLVTLSAISEMIEKAVVNCQQSAIENGFANDDRKLDDGGSGARAYGEAVGVYLSLILSKSIDSNNSLCPWEPTAQCVRQLFNRQSIPMLWDFGEANPLLDSSGGFLTNVDVSTRAFDTFSRKLENGFAYQLDASKVGIRDLQGKVISTDPPYYDNIGYADLSDFFFVWLKKSLHQIYPGLYSSVEVPKDEELVATAYRHGGKENAEVFFLDGMTKALRNIAEQASLAYPVTIYYAFKQSETKNASGVFSTGWETFLEAVLKAGFTLTGTWPMRTEMTAALKTNHNFLASSIVLVCQKRPLNALTISRREFVRELNLILPDALTNMTKVGGLIAPVAAVDLSQAIIGPGMAVFSKYAAVLEADGKPMSVRTALQLINRFFAEDDFDHDTQFCLHWFENYGWNEGKFGDADVLARAKGTSVSGLQQAGIIRSSNSIVRLLKPDELGADWQVENDSRISIWEILHRMISSLLNHGETGPGKILAATSRHSESIRVLSYRLYTICERRGWAQDANRYDQLIRAWDGIELAARSVGYTGAQISLFDEDQSKIKESKDLKTKTRKKKV